MLPRAVGDQTQQILYPLCTRFHPAVWAGAFFTPKTDLLCIATVRAVHAAGADTGKNGRKLPLCTAGDFRMPFVINTYKPEDQLFVSGIHKERNIQVCATLNSIVKIIEAQNLYFFFVKKIIFVKLHNIAGKFASLRGKFSFTGFS
ncbi:transposase [Escherichia coli O145:NM str. 2010C-3507]|nr:transposase [Escherichia coli O145:NM str. 2010C-3507]